MRNLNDYKAFIGETFAGNGSNCLLVLKHFTASDTYLVQHGKSKYRMHGACVRMAIYTAEKNEAEKQIEAVQTSKKNKHQTSNIITDAPSIYVLHRHATNHEGAYATCRLLPPPWQEWAEHCDIDGVPAKIYYIFQNSDCLVEDASEMPWNWENVSKIVIAEKDDEGYFDSL